MTNAERIRKMTDDELADFLADPAKYEACNYCEYLFVKEEPYGQFRKCHCPEGFVCVKEYAAVLLYDWLISESDK